MVGLHEPVDCQVPPCLGSCPMVHTPRLWQGERVAVPAGEHPASPTLTFLRTFFARQPESFRRLVGENCWHGIWFQPSFITAGPC